MKKYLVIGNPIQHSLSTLIHNNLFKKYNIEASYEKKLINRNSLKDLILDIKDKKIDGINVTVPFKNEVIPYLDELSLEAKTTQSVNTIYYDKNKIIGHNTDIEGFESSIIDTEYKIKNKKILILGAGGVVSSIIFTLNKMEVSKIFISNRTKEKAEKFKNLFKNIFVIDWGELVDVDVIINATSIGLNIEDVINLDFSKIGKDKFFYDVIYNPKETNFLKDAKKLGNKTINGKMMFIYQALAAFEIWHGVKPKIDKDVIRLFD